MTFQKELEVAARAAREAGRSLSEWEQPPEKEWKGRIDPVSEADRKAESAAETVLMDAFPSDTLVAEESYERKEADVRGTRRWYLDPLDGTVNFLRGFDHWCVSLAFVDSSDQTECAAVYCPPEESLYTAIRGEGSHRNGEPLQVRTCEELRRALLGSGFPYEFEDPAETNLSEWASVTPHALSMRSLGAAALDLCEVARGRLDGFWEIQLEAWDITAGALIAREAGATVTTRDGTELKGPSTSVVAAPPGIHGDLLERLHSSSPLE